MWGAREMKNGGADELHSLQNGCFFGSRGHLFGTSSLTQWVLSVHTLPVLLGQSAQVLFSS